VFGPGASYSIFLPKGTTIPHEITVARESVMLLLGVVPVASHH
jgi:hypothetical protein